MLTARQHQQIQDILALGERFVRRDYAPRSELADEGYRLLALESAEATKAILGETSPFGNTNGRAYRHALLADVNV